MSVATLNANMSSGVMGYGGYRRHHGYYPYGGYRRNYGYSPSVRRLSPSLRLCSLRELSILVEALGYGNGYGGVGRRWPPPYVDGYERSGYEERPRPPAPILYEGEYEAAPDDRSGMPATRSSIAGTATS